MSTRPSRAPARRNLLRRSCTAGLLCALAIPLAASAAPGQVEVEVCSESAAPLHDPTLIHAEWGDAGQLVIFGAEAVPTTVTVSALVRFGPLKTGWTEQPLSLEPGELATLDLVAPPETFPHELATTYTGDLLVRVDVRMPDGRPGQEVALPLLMIAWPDGPGSDARLWLPRQGPPHGVLDPELQRLAELVAPNARVSPPVSAFGPPQRALPDPVARTSGPALPTLDDDEVSR